MTFQELVDVIKDCLDDVVFNYNNKYCSVTSIVIDSIPIFTLRFGDFTKQFNDAEQLVNDKFFNGKSLKDIFNTIKIELY